MVDLFKIGFVVVSIISVAALGLIFSIVGFDSKGTTVEYISALGSLIGGIAGLSAAVAAYIGVDAWKKQIMYGRYLGAIWDAKVHLRMVQRALTDCTILQAVMVNNAHNKSDEMKAELVANKTKLKELEGLFASSCGVLDRIVTKNDWEWQNYASDLTICITKLLKEPVHEIAGVVDVKKFFEARIKDHQTLQDLVGRLDKQLDELEAKYS